MVQKDKLGQSIFRQSFANKTPIIGNISNLDRSPLSVNPFLKKDSKIAVLKTEEDVLAVLPEKEFSSTHNTFPKFKFINKPIRFYVLKIIQLQNNNIIVVVSKKKYEEEKSRKELDDLKNSSNIKAKVKGFTEYSAILTYKNLQLELFNHDFSENHDIKTSQVLKVNDLINIKFDRLTKKGRVIRVKPLILFPQRVYEKKKKHSDFKVNDVAPGKIVATTPSGITVMLGIDENDLNKNGKMKSRYSMITATMKHPDPVSSEFMTKDVPVTIRITKETPHNFYAELVSINLATSEDNHILYMKLIKNLNSEGEN